MAILKISQFVCSCLDWFIPFFRVNKLRVLGGDTEDDIFSRVERAPPSPPSFLLEDEKMITETEEPTDTEDYYDVDLEDAITTAAVRKSWMELLGDNLARNDETDEPMPRLTSYTTSSSSSRSPSAESESPPRKTFSRFEI